MKALLATAGVRSVTVADPVYRRTMTYRAIPLAELLKDTGIGADDYVQARATDNFSVGIPGRLAASADPAQVEAFLAIEDPAAPWPPIPGKQDKASAGPFYIVWRLAPSVQRQPRILGLPPRRARGHRQPHEALARPGGRPGGRRRAIAFAPASTVSWPCAWPAIASTARARANRAPISAGR